MTNTDHEPEPDTHGRALLWWVIGTVAAVWFGFALVTTVLDFARHALVLVAVAALVFVVAKFGMSSSPKGGSRCGK